MPQAAQVDYDRAMNALTAADRYILILHCPDRKGVVAAVSGFLADNDASIVESSHFNDGLADQF